MKTQTQSADAWQEILFVLLAFVGLVGAWAQVGGYLSTGFLAGNIAFWKDTVTTPAGIFINVDFFVVAAVLFTWMFAEGRRLGISPLWLWGYFLGSLFVAISFAFPMFMAHRQRLIRTQHPEQHCAPSGSGIIVVALSVLLALGAAVYSLMHLP